MRTLTILAAIFLPLGLACTNHEEDRYTSSFAPFDGIQVDLSVDPSNQVAVGTRIRFTASTHAPLRPTAGGVDWESHADPSLPGQATLEAQGMTAWLTTTAPGNFWVTARSQDNPSRYTDCFVRIHGLQLNPPQATLPTGGSQRFTATAVNMAQPDLLWSVEPAGAGLVPGSDGSALFTAPPAGGTFTIRVASAQDPGLAVSAQVLVTAVPPSGTVTLTPAQAVLAPGGHATFTAVVSGITDPAVSWSAAPAGGWRLDPGPGGTAEFTAPLQEGSYTVRATSVADGRAYGEAQVRVENGIAVAIAPATRDALPGERLVFTATVTGTTNQELSWSCNAGTFYQTSSGKGWAAPPQPGLCTIRATSVADPTRFAEAVVQVLPSVSLVADPRSTILVPDAETLLTVRVTGATNSALTWTASAGSLTPGAGGTAHFRAPSQPGTCTVTATSVQDPSKSLTIPLTIGDRVSYVLNYSHSLGVDPTFTVYRSQLPAEGIERIFSTSVNGTSPGGIASFQGGSDWFIDAGAGSAATTSYTCSAGPNGTWSGMHTIRWRIPASVAAGSYRCILHPIADPTRSLTIRLVVLP